MSNFILYWQEVYSELTAGRSVFCSFVIDCTPGSPGTVGAQLLLTENGKKMGTIGGGSMELSVLKIAEKRLVDGDEGPEMTELTHRRDTQKKKSGLICSGQQTNFSIVLKPERDGLAVGQLIDFLKHDVNGWLHVSEEGVRVAPMEANEVIGSDEVIYGTEKNLFFRKQILNRKRIAIIGGGHCGAALARVMLPLGFQVKILDPRFELFASDSELRSCYEPISDFSKAAAAIQYPGLTDVIVMTPSYPSDVQALSSLVDCEYRFIGVMGSQAKLRAIESALIERGVSKRWIQQLKAPVGIPFNSDTPEEIAISVAAHILQSRKPRVKPERVSDYSERKADNTVVPFKAEQAQKIPFLFPHIAERHVRQLSEASLQLKH